MSSHILHKIMKISVVSIKNFPHYYDLEAWRELRHCVSQGPTRTSEIIQNIQIEGID